MSPNRAELEPVRDEAEAEAEAEPKAEAEKDFKRRLLEGLEISNAVVDKRVITMVNKTLIILFKLGN